MKCVSSTHEHLADRLANILTKLNVGHQLSVKELAEEFQVSTRTIERDFDRLNAYLPLLQDQRSKRYYLDSSYLGRFKLQDIQNFAQLSGISDLYPSLDISFLRELMDHRANLVFSAKGYHYEDTTQYAEHFKVLTQAIQQKKSVAFAYKGSLREVLPYRLIHHHGNWYLAAVDQDTLRVYRLSRIEQVDHTHIAQDFEHQSEILQQLEDEEGIWFGHDKQEIRLSVDAEVALYFKQRRLFPEQQILQEKPCGELLISCQIRHEMQLYPLVRYWIPHLKIVEPAHLQENLVKGLSHYIC